MVLANTQEAKWVRVEDGHATELEHIHEPFERSTDAEGFFMSGFAHSDAIKAGTPDTRTKKEENHILKHLRHTAAYTKDLWNTGAYAHLCCVIPEQLKNTMQAELDRAGIIHTYSLVLGNYINTPKEELPAIFAESFRL